MRYATGQHPRAAHSPSAGLSDQESSACIGRRMPLRRDWLQSWVNFHSAGCAPRGCAVTLHARAFYLMLMQYRPQGVIIRAHASKQDITQRSIKQFPL
jgi:hypothetical protein